MRKKFFFVIIILFLFCIATVFVAKKSAAFSTDSAISFEVAESGLRLYLGKFQNTPKSSSLNSLGVCAGGVFSGNYFTIGKYEVSFYGAGDQKLDCGSRLSSVVFIRSKSFYRGASMVVQWGVGALPDGKTFTCSGSRPSDTLVYPEDDTELTSNVAWTYSETDTEPKCQYHCDDTYIWNGSACIKSSNEVDPIDPKTNVLLLSTHFDDEAIWFEPWLKIADTVVTPTTYPMTPYQEQQIGMKYLTASWVMAQGKLDDENLAEYRAHDREYRKQYLTDQYITSLVEDRVRLADVIVTHSPWGGIWS